MIKLCLRKQNTLKSSILGILKEGNKPTELLESGCVLGHKYSKGISGYGKDRDFLSGYWQV